MAADERDSGWESEHPRFRVFFYRGGDQPGRSWSVLARDVLDAEVTEVVDWARSEIGAEGLFAVALVDDKGPERGLVWLVGTDANDDRDDGTTQARRTAMQDRRRAAANPGS